MSAKLLFLLHRRRWQFCSSLHQAIAICSGRCCYRFEGAKEEQIQPDFQTLHCLLGQLLGKKRNQLFASRSNCSIGETTAVVMPGNAWKEQEVVGNGAVVQGSVQGRAHQPLSIFVPVFQCLKKHGNSANPYGFHTGRKDVTIKAKIQNS